MAGQKLYRAGKYREALKEFETAYQLKPNAVVTYNIGRCYERVGDNRTAMRKYQDYLHEIPDAADQLQVQRAIAELEKKFEKQGVQQLAVYAQPSGAEVSVDGKLLGLAPVSADLSPGKHRLRVSARTFEPSERDFTMPAKTSLQFDVSLSKTPAPVVLTPVGDGSFVGANASSGLSTRYVPQSTGRRWTYVLGGAAVVAGGFGLFFGLSSASASRTLRDGTVRAHSELQPIADRASGQATAANIAYATAGGAAVAAVVLYFVEDRHPPTPDRSAVMSGRP